MTTPHLPRHELQKLLDQDARQKEALVAARDKIVQLSSEPNSLGYYLGLSREDGKIIVSFGGREMRVMMPEFPLTVGDTVVFNDKFQIVGVEGTTQVGTVAYVDEVLEEGRVVVSDGIESEVVLRVPSILAEAGIEDGSTVRVDLKAGLVLELLGDVDDDTKDLTLEEVPDVTYDDIGGLKDQLSKIHDAIELPTLFPEAFAKFKLSPPKGVLLYGPPGCGKTMVAKAIARSLGDKCENGKAFFINVKGPELLNKYVGETERLLREIFTKAKDKASEGFPVVIFFDEMDSMFRQRGAGISSDMEATVVPTLLAEMDGVEELRNVIVVGATNRQDLIDPALLRPGRLDVKIEINRPDKEGARVIFSKYLTSDLPLISGLSAADLVDVATSAMYREDESTQFLEVVYENGSKQVMHFKDFASGAMIKNIVDRAKTAAVKELLAGGPEGISDEHLKAAVVEEFRETEDLPNTTNPDDWKKISGIKGERIARINPLLKKPEEKQTDAVATIGQYL